MRVPSWKRYGTTPEYAFVLSKGRPLTVNLIRDHENKTGGSLCKSKTRCRDGSFSPGRFTVVKDWGVRPPVWEYAVGSNVSTTDTEAFKHPALMSEQIARDLIVSYSNEGDLVFDPMAGSGTTLKMALLLGRHYLGMEIFAPYCEIARTRLRDTERRMLEQALAKRAG